MLQGRAVGRGARLVGVAEDPALGRGGRALRTQEGLQGGGSTEDAAWVNVPHEGWGEWARLSMGGGGDGVSPGRGLWGWWPVS